MRINTIKATFIVAFVFLVWSVLAAAQTVTIHTDNAKILVEWGNGGTVAKPFPEGGGFYSIDLPDRMGVLITTQGKDQPFRRITTDRRVVYTVGSRPMLGEFGVEYIPDDPAAYRRGGSHELLGFEALPVLFPNDAHLPPTQETVRRIQLELRQITNLDAIASWPRAVRLLQAFDDRGLPQRTAFGDTDMGWLIHHWDYTTGERPLVGWYNGVCPRGAGGLNNWHYNSLLWLATHYVAAPRDELYRFGLQQAIAHATFGRSWSGPDAGFARYEKGEVFIGENFSSRAWEKQWSAGLIVWARMTGNPILRMQTEMMREQIRKSDPDTVWEGQWGARIGSRYLDEMLVHYLDRREEWIVAKAKRFIENCRKWQLEDGTWPNRGSPTTRSPWMQVQLVAAIYRWQEHRPDLAAAFPRDELLAAGDAVWNTGTTKLWGHTILKYRFEGPEENPSSIHATAFAVPMLRYMATVAPQTWGPVYRETEAFIYGWAGSSFSDLAKGVPIDMKELGIRLPREGPGWSKSLFIYLEGLR